MKHKICLMLLVFVLQNIVRAQTVKRMYTFYLGINNFVKVHDSIKNKGRLYITASGNSRVRFTNDTFFVKLDTSLYLNDTLLINIVCKTKNNKILHKETRKYSIKNTPKPQVILGILSNKYLLLNKRQDNLITKEEFIKQDSLWVECGGKNFPYNSIFSIDSFTLLIMPNGGKSTIYTERLGASKIPTHIKERVYKLPKGSIIMFNGIIANNRLSKTKVFLAPIVFTLL